MNWLHIKYLVLCFRCNNPRVEFNKNLGTICPSVREKDCIEFQLSGTECVKSDSLVVTFQPEVVEVKNTMQRGQQAGDGSLDYSWTDNECQHRNLGLGQDSLHSTYRNGMQDI